MVTRSMLIAVLTYCIGDKEWTAKQFYTVANFVPCSYNLVYSGGMLYLYIVSPCGQLASYNIVNGELKFEFLLVNQLFLINFHFSTRLKCYKTTIRIIMVLHSEIK